MIVTSCPAIVAVPLRGTEFAFEAAASVTVPFPCPDEAPAAVSHAACGSTDQPQVCADAATLNVTLPPPIGTEVFCGVTLYVQPLR